MVHSEVFPAHQQYYFVYTEREIKVYVTILFFHHGENLGVIQECFETHKKERRLSLGLPPALEV